MGFRKSHLIFCWMQELDEVAPEAKTFWAECMNWFDLSGVEISRVHALKPLVSHKDIFKPCLWYLQAGVP